MKELCDRLAALRMAVSDEGRPDAVERQHKRGKNTARERISLLIDQGTFTEVGALVQPAQDTELTSVLEAPADGLITGSARINGRPCYIVSMDYTVLGGSGGEMSMRKFNLITERAYDHGLPVVFLMEGAGHRIQDGLDARHFARADAMFALLARLSGWVPTIAALFGPCFAGPTNISAFCTLRIMLRDGTAMGIGGPPLVKAGTGETLDMYELGGAAIQADEQGVAHLAVATEQDCMEVIRRYLSYFPDNSSLPPPMLSHSNTDDMLDDGILDLVPTNSRRAYDVKKVVEKICDQGSILELKPTHAPNMVTALARLGGRSVGVIANQPMKLSGMIDSKAAEKAANFIATCDAFGIALVYFVDVPGFHVGPQAEKTTMALRSAKMLYELAKASVPRLSVILRKGYGAGYYAMNGGRGFCADGTWVWPTAEICAMSLEAAINVIYRRQFEQEADGEQKLESFRQKVRENLSAWRAAEHMGIDDVIDPRETRRLLIEALSRLPLRPKMTHTKAVRTIPPI